MCEKWSLCSPLEFGFHVVELGLELEVYFPFSLLASLMSFFLVAFTRPVYHEYQRILQSTCDGVAFGSSLSF